MASSNAAQRQSVVHQLLGCQVFVRARPREPTRTRLLQVALVRALGWICVALVCEALAYLLTNLPRVCPIGRHGNNSLILCGAVAAGSFWEPAAVLLEIGLFVVGVSAFLLFAGVSLVAVASAVAAVLAGVFARTSERECRACMPQRPPFAAAVTSEIDATHSSVGDRPASATFALHSTHTPNPC